MIGVSGKSLVIFCRNCICLILLKLMERFGVVAVGWDLLGLLWDLLGLLWVLLGYDGWWWDLEDDGAWLW